MDYFDLRVKEFSDAIVKFVNETALPVEAKRLALFEICQKLLEESNKVAIEQIKERDQNEQSVCKN